MSLVRRLKRMKARREVLIVLMVILSAVSPVFGAQQVRIPQWAENLLVEAKVSGNLESYRKGLRGAANHMIYDVQRKQYLQQSQWHEYGVGAHEVLGVIKEALPAWWMAEWKTPIEANLIVLSGVYSNQPQPNTGWKIELRRDSKWTTQAKGVGGWYDSGRYVWGGPGTKPIRFDALRVSVFSKDEQTPLKSIHFRGEKGLSWVVANCGPIDAQIKVDSQLIRAGQPITLEGIPLAGKIKTWRWEFGDGQKADGQKVSHTFDKTGTLEITLVFSDGTYSDRLHHTVRVIPPVEARITPLTKPVMEGKPVRFAADTSIGKVKKYQWDFGHGKTSQGTSVQHTFAKSGIYKVKLTVSDGHYSDDCMAIVRVHTQDTLNIPQVFLDTDQKNEVDDQHYLGYGLFSELDLLGVNSIHHGGGQEPVNYSEILHIIELSEKSGLPKERVPFVFRGANERLKVPQSRQWYDTQPIVTEASEAILAAARGATPGRPVWIVPVGPGTNIASAILQARIEGLDLKERLRVMWLGSSNNALNKGFNGNNDPWSIYVLCRSGLETWIIPEPVGARVAVDKRKEAHLYADNALGQYLLKIVPARNKALYDASCLSAIISLHLKLGWIKETEFIKTAGDEQGYRWSKTDSPATVRVIQQIDQQAMKMDLFNTMKGKPLHLRNAGKQVK